MSLQELNQSLRALRTLQAPEQVVFDHADRSWKVSSAAFKPQSDGSISVDLEEALLSDGKELTFGYPRIARAVGLIAQPVGKLSATGFTVTHVPVEGNEYHGEAAGSPTRGARQQLAATCEMIIPIVGDQAHRELEEKLARQAQFAATQATGFTMGER